jgi:protein-disulfide isomerase-like protein with CxxC motif
VLNALENIRSSIAVIQRARQMSSLEDLREGAGLALAEVDDALQVLSAGAFKSTSDSQILASRAQLLGARSLLLAVAAQASATGAGNALEESTRRLRAARIDLVDDSTLPATFRN